MIRRPTLTFTLSYLFVAAAALVLRQPAKLSAAGSSEHNVATTQPVAPDRPQGWVSTPSSPWPSGEDPFATVTAAPTGTPLGREHNREAASVGIASPSLPTRARRPTASFTRGEVGESVAGVARRVYGDPRFARDLWLANRDCLDSPDALLAERTLLRTPPIAASSAP